MSEMPLTEKQQRDLEALESELFQQAARAGVDLEGIGHRLREARPRVERPIADDELEIEVAFDLSAIVTTLRTLPDGAGTDAFVDAYNRRA